MLCCIVAPAAPTGLATVSTTPTSVLLNWTAPTPANGVISYYTVLLLNSTSPSAVNTSSTNVTSENVTGLTACTTYEFAVSATTQCSGCTGPHSTSLTTTTPANSTLRLKFIISHIWIKGEVCCDWQAGSILLWYFYSIESSWSGFPRVVFEQGW